MDRKGFDRWASIRAKGQGRFVWRVGVLGFGGMMALGMLAAHWFGHPRHPAFWGLVCFIPLPCLMGGYIFGLGMWGFMEWDYRHAKALFDIVSGEGVSCNTGSPVPGGRPQVDDQRIKAGHTGIAEMLLPPKPASLGGLSRGTLAAKVVDALIDAGLLEPEQFRKAFDLVSEAIDRDS